MNAKTKNLVFQMCLVAIFAALDFVITYFIAIPITLGGAGSGYFNFSDVLIFALAAIASPLAGGIAGGISGLFSDISLGWGLFAPYTLVIKFIEGIVAGYFFRFLKKFGKDNKGNDIWKSLVSFIIGGLLMAVLYMVPDIVTYVTTPVVDGEANSYLFVFIDLLFNSIQGLINAGIGCVVFMALYQVRGLFTKRLSLEKANIDNQKVSSDDGNNQKGI